MRLIGVPWIPRKVTGQANIRLADNVSRQRTQRVEGRFLTPRQLFLHVLLDQMHGNMPRALVHDLDVVLPGDTSQLTLGLKLGELRVVISVGDGPRAQPVAE